MRLLRLGGAFCVLIAAAPARAQIGEPVVEIVIEQEGQPVTEPFEDEELHENEEIAE